MTASDDTTIRLIRYADESSRWTHGMKTEDELLQRIWNLAGDVRSLAARAEAAEKERDEAQDALQNLAADHYFARAEAAEARISILERQVQNLGSLAAERQARCATLEAALGGLATAVKHYVEFEPEWNVGGEWSDESTAAWKRIEETLDANIAAALTAATPPAECDGSGECKAQTHTHGCYSDRGNCDQPTEHVMGRRVRAALDGL